MKMLTDAFNMQTFVKAIQHKEEMRISEIGHGMTSICYMVSSDDTFNDEYSRECRGITFDTHSGKVTSRPLHKFFNLNEREETRADSIDWTKVVRVMDKRDGSLIHTVALDDGEMLLKSKKAFTSDVAIAAQKFYDSRENFVSFGRFCNLVNLTAIFEYTSPDSRIVLFYPEQQLTLLHLRNNETGLYTPQEDLVRLAAAFDIPVVEEVTEFFDLDGVHGKTSIGSRRFKIERMIEAAANRENVEGWVVQFVNGDMIKVKTEWYLKRHHAMTFLRERDIAQLVLDEGLDDIKSLLVGDGVDITSILEIEAAVVSALRDLAATVDDICKTDGGLQRKEFALKHRGHPHFGLIMSQYTGKDPSFKEYFERNMLKDMFSLRQLGLSNVIE